MLHPITYLIHHTNHYSQYYSLYYQTKLKKNFILISISKKKNYFNNTIIETFFKTLKT